MANDGGEGRPWCVLDFSDAAHGVAGVAVRSLPFRVGMGTQASDLVGGEVLAGEAQCVLGVAGGHLELEAVADIPLVVNGETLRGGERRRLAEGDSVSVFAFGELAFAVRNLRVEADGSGGGEEGRNSIAGGAVNATMECCDATVLPTVLAQHRCSPVLFRLWFREWLGPDNGAGGRCTRARRCFRVRTACVQAAKPPSWRPWLCQTPVRAARERNQPG